MVYYNNILCVEARWLVDNGVMTVRQYRHLRDSNQIYIARRGCRGTPALVSYDSIPERFKPMVKEVLGCDPREAAKVSQVESRIVHDAEISRYFEEDYLLPDGRRLPKETRAEYYANAIVLEAIGRLLSDKTAFKRSRSSGRVTHNWKEIAEGVQDLDRTRYPHTLPANERRLRDRFNRYKKEGLESLIHKNFTNMNAAKVDDDVKESYLIEFISAPNNLDDAQVARVYNALAGHVGWKQISPATVANYREKHFATTYAGRRGSVAFSNKIGMQVKRSAPTAPLFHWSLDGWDVELLYQKTETDKNGRSTTTYHHRPTVVVVLDTCVKYPIGYAVGTHETPELIQAALRNAAKHTRELFGKMYKAHQIQSDNYAIKKMMPFYEAMADKVTPARVKNAKAKPIEPYFGQINKKWCQLLNNWSGFGITSDREKQPNAEFLNNRKTSFPDFDGVCKQIDMIMSREREEKVERFMQLWEALDDGKKIELSRESYLRQFGETTGRTILLQHSGIHPTILGQRRSYDCFDVTFRDHGAVKWTIYYDPDDLGEVLAMNEDESLRYMLEEKYVQPMALADRKPGDAEQLQRVREFNRAHEELITGRRATSGNIVREHMRENGLIEDETLRRLLITDSNGQHKDVRSKARTGKILPVVEVELVEVEKEPADFDFDRY
ncbi:MAG TPA: hypothetical protein GXX67_06290 [Petrimonas sp.]|jgi:hypothetical protein|nr:hypothetical protein [Petrimonas sp.]